ncbi:3-hydroxyacyl-CoA dehydrogenase/enoyl-CoA hydratase family protein [Carnobacterium sp. ISL-102]|uniref:3-hydroxyacyl-CoA dehydrogenase/crotonase FadB n=1 Tax=Carnobacterium sp. ISL-102 TaxID=2819142 RepID=UPI001BECAB87|nr:3-hydroxyacyl-CoA dehydrogenase/enoyl-CoA hydratase family protein [Carnobacterium sp. ISL-102]MBT2731160.1 3-hydroxyacyl-CoA dehydrogenase [Carnobacterium sp. ISL-102]
MNIKKATVLGAGTMGAQIAALLVNAGLKVKLLDIVLDKEDKNKLSKGAYDRITHPKKSMLYNADWNKNLTYGNFEDDLKEGDDSDIFIEAVTEKLAIKHDLWLKVAAIARKDAILASNTSSIPIGAIAKPLPEEAKARFVGVHFFNPPRYMKLVEIIPHEATDPVVTEDLKTFVSTVLGKGAVDANDVSGFVANRIGTYSASDTAYRAEQLGLSITEVDAITGKIIGRPKTGTFRLLDMVGIDIGYFVTKTMMSNPEETEYFKMPKLVEKMVALGNLGDKTKQGFYKKDGRKRLVFDVKTETYVEPKPVELAILKEFSRDLKKNLTTIFESEDEVGIFLWETLRNLMYYSAINVPKATNEYINIDRAMVWGYNWSVGPFQLWDMMGLDKVKARMEKELGELPEWIKERNEPFYQEGQSISPASKPEDFAHKQVWKKEDSELFATQDNFLMLAMRTPNNTITVGFEADIVKAVDVLEKEDYKGLLLYSDGPNFSVGANLYYMKMAIDQELVDTETRKGSELFHEAVRRMKFASKPIVTAAKGRALGGGAELVMASPYVVAAAETYIGLVEAGVGLIPGGGGLAELADRVYRQDVSRADKIRQLADILTKVSTGHVTMSAYEAQQIGFLKETDMIIQNEELVFEAALQTLRLKAAYNYIPNNLVEYEVLGTNFKAIAAAQVDAMVDGHFASKYDGVVTNAIADVLAGGNVPLGTKVNQKWMQKLSEDNFVKLSKNEKTYERIVHMLEKKKPLRN